MPANPNDLFSRMDLLKSGRAVLDSHLEEVRNFIIPIAKSFITKEVLGQKNRQEILDNTAESVSEILAATIHGLMVNPGTNWFSIRVIDDDLNDDEDVTKWLQHCIKILNALFESPQSNFQTQISQVLQELVDFGTAGMYIADRPGKLPLFSARSIQELYIDENSDGNVDTVFRWFELSARQAMQEWGKLCGEKIQKAAEDPKKQDDNFEFLHAIMPRSDRFAGGMDAKNLPVASIWLSACDKAVIRESGYHEMPMIVARLSKRTGEKYGRGRGMVALSDVKMLQSSMKVTIRGAQKAIDPSLMVADDGVLGKVRSNSSGITYIRSELLNSRHLPIQPMLTGARPDLGEEFMQGIRTRIERAYYNQLIQMSRDPRMTATQVLQIAEETMRILGPHVGRLQNELIGLVVSRTFGVSLRGGMFKPPPKKLLGKSLQVEYVSPLATAQRLSEVRAISQLFDAAAPIIQLHPEVTDNINQDAAFRRIGDRVGVPRDVMRDTKVVADMRTARQQAAKAEQTKQDIANLAPAAQSLAQAAAAAKTAGVGGGVSAAPFAAPAQFKMPLAA